MYIVLIILIIILVMIISFLSYLLIKSYKLFMNLQITIEMLKALIDRSKTNGDYN